MEQKILDFIDLLRQNGCRVSTPEALDCYDALSITGLADRDTFRSALRTTLVKSTTEAATFDHLFELFFINPFSGLETPDTGSALDKNMLDELADLVPDELSPLTKALIERDTVDLQRMIQNAAEEAGTSNIFLSLQEGLFTQRLLNALEWDQTAGEINLMLDALGASTSGPGRYEAREFLEALLERLPQIVRETVERIRKQNQRTNRYHPNPQSILDKDFFNLTDDEKRWIKEAVKKLAEKMKTSLSARSRTYRRGKLNVPKTLRRNMESGGVPFRPVFDWRRRRKRRIVILCDVSASVGYAARLMLHFVYSLQELFARVRSFVFVSELGEVTGLFDRMNSDDAFEAVMKNKVINTNAYTHYGAALKHFNDDYGHIVNRKTTIIILGDARSNYGDPREDILRDLSRRAHLTFWLNPESRYNWNHDDSVVYAYEPHCDEIFEIRNTRQLFHAVDRITRGDLRQPPVTI